MRNLLLPPIDTIFGSLPDDTNLHIVRGDNDSIAASSFAEIAIARLSVVVCCPNPFSMTISYSVVTNSRSTVDRIIIENSMDFSGQRLSVEMSFEILSEVRFRHSKT